MNNHTPTHERVAFYRAANSHRLANALFDIADEMAHLGTDADVRWLRDQVSVVRDAANDLLAEARDTWS